MRKRYKTLRLILGDQLNASHSWYKNKDDDTLYLIAELKQETDYTLHHIQKICAFFSAMSEFAEALKKSGHHCLHLTLDDTKNFNDLPDLLTQVCKKYHIEHFEYQRPDEYRLLTQLDKLKIENVEKSCIESAHFFLEYGEIKNYFTSDKAIKMEFFYRKMRQRFNILMDGDKPEGGKWNFDEQNRNKLKKSDLEGIPEPLVFSNDISATLKRLKKHNIKTFGNTSDSLLWPINRKQAQELLRYFCKHLLPNFGTFQDAMTCNSELQWSLYHSRLSFAINAKILSPKQVIESAIDAYRESNGAITLAQIEGFVRQILGWREYIRGMYWVNMPDYPERNALNAQKKLPAFYWNADTNMQCMHQAIQQSLDYAYAHHIQRLMITGNFAMLVGIKPKEIEQWYLGIYIDAIEWVELPNTMGMSQFADGGLIATKPYAAGGNYINKMSDYCRSCHYSVKEKTGDSSCPFNSLYWDFMLRHRERFEQNPRIGMIYKTWDKQDSENQKAVLKRAHWCRSNLDKL